MPNVTRWMSPLFKAVGAAATAALLTSQAAVAAEPAKGPPVKPAAAAPAAPAAPRALAIGVDSAELKWGPCPAMFKPGCQIAVLQGDPSKPNADVFFRIPPGYVIPAHSHTSAERMVLVSGELEVHYKGQPLVTLKKGDYAYGPAMLPHVGRCKSPDACTLLIAFEQPVDAVAFADAIP